MDINDEQSLDLFFEQLLEAGLFRTPNGLNARILYQAFKEQTSVYSVHHFMFGMWGVIYLFDSAFWGIYSIEESYTKLFNELIQITRGSIQPTAVSFKQLPLNEEQSSVDFSFGFKDQMHQYQLTQMGDIVDLKLVQYLNLSMAAGGINGRYYWIETHDQMIATAFLTDEQYGIIKPRYNEFISPFEDQL